MKFRKCPFCHKEPEYTPIVYLEMQKQYSWLHRCEIGYIHILADTEEGIAERWNGNENEESESL